MCVEREMAGVMNKRVRQFICLTRRESHNHRQLKPSTFPERYSR